MKVNFENQYAEKNISKFAKQNKLNVKFTYMGDLDIIDELLSIAKDWKYLDMITYNDTSDISIDEIIYMTYNDPKLAKTICNLLDWRLF